eukprot:7930502-Alexandrium_andersonii.AAC.1
MACRTRAKYPLPTCAAEDGATRLHAFPPSWVGTFIREQARGPTQVIRQVHSLRCGVLAVFA